MPRFRTKPCEIEAFRYWIDDRPDWFCDKVSANEIVTYDTHCEIKTLEGVMRGEVGDWIVQGLKGEIYPCKPEPFAMKYEPVDPSGLLAPPSESRAMANNHEPTPWPGAVVGRANLTAQG
jgi:hypothetical protein